MQTMPGHIGIALSGGGHRATLWGLGVLLYLVDSGKNREVGVVSSVSGGSIVNGVVAQEVDFLEVDTATFDRRIQPLVRHVSDVGLFFWGPATNTYVISVFTLVAAALGAGVAGIAFLAAEGLSPRSGALVVIALVLLVVSAYWFKNRSRVADRALARTHYTSGGTHTLLSDVERSIDHVFCSTELQSGDHLYLSARFIYSYQLGIGSPAHMKLSTAVQASACLPGAFAPRRLSTSPYDFRNGVAGQQSEMVLTDGGVYDNMADQWITGLAGRLDRQPNMPVKGREITEVIVVNASAGEGWRPFPGSRLPFLEELATLKRCSDVMYDVTTSQRRQNLVSRWDNSERFGDGMRGALVHIAQSPYLVADYYMGKGASDWPDRAERARAVLARLGNSLEDRRRWQERARGSRKVKTVLRKLGIDDTLGLLRHAYVLSMCNLHVLLGYPLLDVPTPERFAKLLDGAVPTGSLS